MTISEINSLRRDGHPDEAYAECRKLLDLNPADRYSRVAMAWCLKTLAEKAAAEKNPARFIEVMGELEPLRLDEIDEAQMVNRFAWDIRTLFEALRNQPDTLLDTADRIFATLRKLPMAPPDRYYSILAESFMRVKGRLSVPWMQFTDFMEWYGFENLRPQDYNRVQLKQSGHTLPSLAERLHSVYYKVLMTHIKAGTIEPRLMLEFIERLTRLNEEHPEYQYTLYHKAQLLMSAGQREAALQAILPFVKRKRNEFWIWAMLAELSDTPEMSLSCCCRALSCRADEKFLGKVRLKTAHLMHQAGFNGNARTEIRLLHELYHHNGWRIPTEVVEMVHQPWYQAAEAPASNSDFYAAHLEPSEEYLFTDTPEQAVIITHFNAEKSIYSFVTESRRRGFFSTRQMQAKFYPHRIYHLRLENELQEGKISKILSHRPAQDVTPYEGVFYRRGSGRLRYREGNSYGFVDDDIFVEKQLLTPEIIKDARAHFTAVISFNPRKESWGWKAINLAPAEPDHA